ncbi:2Fe-2S iron-sulfur cluster-binding protein [Gemmata sp.]|uniref:2Fe-2S iron-sulfur cluster-binding protein n=1 Tax=Gemmata sp. TaxID=1914242 RepID=UPI003F707141
MKTLTLEPIHESLAVPTNTDVLKALLAKDLKVLMSCGGKGVCATCHVKVKSGMDRVTPRTQRELRTLAFITGADPSSRLACQCRVLGDGVVVELPEGMYVERAEDLMSLLGTRAAKNLLHPITGAVLIAQGKIITRGRLEELKHLQAEVSRLKDAD